MLEMDKAGADAVFQASAPSHICEICRFPPWTATWFIIDHSHEEVQKSAEAGCFGCQLFNTILQMTPKDIRSSFSVYAYVGSGEFSVSLLRDYGSINIDTFMLPGPDSLPNFRIGRFLPKTTELGENLAMIQTWLRCCEATHSRCTRSSKYVPPRLLDISSGYPSTVRLVDFSNPVEAQQRSNNYRSSEGHIDSPHYACLSHCWGTREFRHITRHNTLAANKLGIPISELPRTFRDAIMVTRALHIDYLWIDSMCILQDDKSDWDQHVEAMAYVYRSAFITLGAGDSTNAEGGFFRTANSIHVEPPSLTYKDESGKEYNVYCRPLPSHPDQSFGKLSSLLQRGWVFQERLLSPRFLCFGQEEIQWECLENVACSCSTTDDGFNWQPHDNRDGPGFPHSSSTKFTLARLNELEPDKISQLWREMVSQYSERTLTVPGDKLPALAGLAKLFQQAKADRYSEGLFLRTIEHDLAWLVSIHRGKGEFNGRSQPEATWSWAAACEGTIMWVDNLTKPHWQVQDLIHKRLKVKGYLDAIYLQPTEMEEQNMTPLQRFCRVYRWVEQAPNLVKDRENSQDILSGTQHDDNGINIMYPTDYSHVLPLTWPTFEIKDDQVNVAHLYSDYKFWESENDLCRQKLPYLFLFHLGSISEKDVPFGHPPGEFGWGFGLVLRLQDGKTHGEDDTTYERVGCLFFHTGKNEDEWEPEGPQRNIVIV